MLVEVGGRRYVEGLVNIAVDRGHEIGRIFCVQVDLIGGHAGEVARGVVCDVAQLDAVPIIVRRRCVGQCVGIVVAGFGVIAALLLYVIADAVGVGVLGTVTPADADGVSLVAFAVAVASGNFGAATCVNVARAIANATDIQGAYAVVHIVTNAVGIGIGRAVSTTDTSGIQHIAITVTRTGRDVIASACPNCSGAIADATLVNHPNAIIHIVADAIFIDVCSAIASAYTQGIRLVAIAIAVTCRNFCTATSVDVAGAIADATGIQVTDTIVHIIANAIGIGVRGAVATTTAQGIVIEAIAAAATRWAASFEAKWKAQHKEIGVVSFREDLHMDRSSQITRSGELPDEHTSIGVGQAIGVSVQDVPHTSNFVVDDNVTAGQSTARFKGQCPILVG